MVVVHSLDRLARNLNDLEEVVARITDKGAQIEFKNEPLVFKGADDSMQRLILQIMETFAQFERALIKDRQAQGIQIEKAKGKYKGKPKKFSQKHMVALYEDYENQDMFRLTKKQIAEKYGISERSMFRYIKEERIRRASK